MPIIVYYDFQRLPGLKVFDLLEVGDVQALLENPILVNCRLSNRGRVHICVVAPRLVVVLVRSESQLLLLKLRGLSFG